MLSSVTPVSQSNPDGQSIATRNASRLSNSTDAIANILAAIPLSGIRAPVPNMASMKTSALLISFVNIFILGSSSGVITVAPASKALCLLSALLSFALIVNTLTMAPDAASNRATTKPSPPLLPGPTTTTKRFTDTSVTRS